MTERIEPNGRDNLRSEAPCNLGAPEAPGALKPAAYTNLELLKLFRWCSHAQRPAGSPHGQNRLLRTLVAHGPMTQRDLAEAVQRTPATLSQQLESMESAGLVVREKCPGDRRTVLVSLTEEGAAAAERMAAEQRRHADELFGGLGDADRAELGRILWGLLERWGGAGSAAHALGRADAGSRRPAGCGARGFSAASGPEAGSPADDAPAEVRR